MSILTVTRQRSSSVDSQSTHTRERPDMEFMYPVNVKDVLIAKANAGEAVYKHQLVRLTPAEWQPFICSPTFEQAANDNSYWIMVLLVPRWTPLKFPT
jgi:hypothetical protein